MHRNVLAAAMFAAAMTMTAAAHAAENAEGEAGTKCEPKVVAKGFPSMIASVANISALRLWVEMTEEQYGPEYSMWHNAASPSIRCNLMKDSEYTMCVAIARPCAMHLAKTEPAKPATQASRP